MRDRQFECRRQAWVCAAAASAVFLFGSSVVAEDLLSREDRARTDRGLVDASEERSDSSPTYSRANYLWPYATGPHYGDEDKMAKAGTVLLHTPVGSFDLTRGLPQLPEALRAQERVEQLGAQHFVVQLDPAAVRTGALERVREAIAGGGGAVVGELPVTALVARLTPAALAVLRGSPDLIALEPYHPAWKLHPTIGRVRLPDPMKAVSEVYDLDVRIFPGQEAEGVARDLAALGASVTNVFPDTVRIDIHRSNLAEVAALDSVQVVFEHVPARPLDEETTTTIQTGAYNRGATPFHDAGVDGSGGGITAGPQVLMVLDNGIQLDAADLSDTRTSAGTPGPSHRKVRVYETTNAFGGDGDLMGCDAGPSDGYTHGHAVSAIALGSASSVDSSYGEPFFATDATGWPWKLDGVAPGAVLVAYDGQRTPAATSCSSPLVDTIDHGDLYSGGATGSLGASYAVHGARTVNFSWGTPVNQYDDASMDIDEFLYDKRDAMVFIAAGDLGSDGDRDNVPDPDSLTSPAGAKNALAIGVSWSTSGYSGDGWEEDRSSSSGVGPAPGQRVAPQLMSPARDVYWRLNKGWGIGLVSTFGCRSADNDQSDPVECDLITNRWGSSFAAPAAAGAAMLVRDYFAQGFYPDGTSSDPGNDLDRVPEISGALVKAALVASADFLNGGYLFRRYRFNNEQGYGRIQLDRVLPLQSWPNSVPGLSVVDGGIDGGVRSIAGLDGVVDVTMGGVDEGNFVVCHPGEELRVALAWLDPVGEQLINDLDLELISPSGVSYWGNYFTDDDDRDGAIDLQSEDCPGIDGQESTRSESEWSLPVCQHADMSLPPRDRRNPTEAVMLSPDPLGDGSTSQIESGPWTVRVVGAGGMEAAQRYALVVSGGVCTGSWIGLDATSYPCNGRMRVKVTEHAEARDLEPAVSEVSARTFLQVLDGTTVLDEESGLGFTRAADGSLTYVADLVYLTGATARDPGNGVLDVRDGDTVRAVYADVSEDGVTPDPERRRESLADVECSTRIQHGNIEFGQIGLDTAHLLTGGCERNARGNFEFGFPDRYMDAGELLLLRFAFTSLEAGQLEEAEIDLRCVLPDADSPADCRPGSTNCPDPRRENNPGCDERPTGHPGDVTYMTILDSPRRIGVVPELEVHDVGFTIRMAETIPGTPEVEMVLAVRAPSSGRTTPGLAVVRQKLDVDEESLFYSTDFPTGGTEYYDRTPWPVGDEVLENPTTNVGNANWDDYRFETRTWSDLTAGGTKNLGLLSPWNFDVNDGGFRSGILTSTTDSTITNTIAQWGEDKNFNGVDDKRCTNDVGRACTRDLDCNSPGQCESVEQRDPADNVLDKSWSIRGGCGWQTKPPGTCSNNSTQGCYDDGDCVAGGTCTGPSTTGGIWHTGRIGGTTGNCLVTGNNPGQCQAYEALGGTMGVNSWREHLVTPAIQRVNGSDYRVEIVDWAWNMALDLKDHNVAWVVDFDTDLQRLEPNDLFVDTVTLAGQRGPVGLVSGEVGTTGQKPAFAPFTADMQNSFNGSAGNDRVGKNACFFEAGAVDPAWCPDCPFQPGQLQLAGPLDNDVDDDGDGQIDEYVATHGPVRNTAISTGLVDGMVPLFDSRGWTIEDQLGEAGEFFQASVGMWNYEPSIDWPSNGISYGIGIDDMVIEWREYTLVEDTTDCSSGECAVVSVGQYELFQGSTNVEIAVLDRSPDPQNDCDLDGDTDGTDDCDADGVRDVVVHATSQAEPTGEVIVLNATGDPFEYRGSVPVSARYRAPGVLFVEEFGWNVPAVTVTYRDNDDGTGQVCRNDVDPARWGYVRAEAWLLPLTGEVTVIATELTDNGDDDAWADTRETVDLRIQVSNKGKQDLTGLVGRLGTDDPKIDCILGTTVWIGDLPAGAGAWTTDAFTFRVADVDRTSLGLSALDELSARFTVAFSSDQFDLNNHPQEIRLDLDLDAVGGGTPTTFFEGFESGTLGAFAGDNIDASLNDLDASDGYRCQYADPDWAGSNTYGRPWCYLGVNPAHAEAFYWQVHTPSAVDGGKAYSGTNSLYMGIFGSAPLEYTTPLRVLEAVGLQDPVNLGVEGAPSILSYKQQVSLMGNPPLPIGEGHAAGRYVTHLQLADEDGNPVGPWIKLQPYLNVYDLQGGEFVNCQFDPIDDGNDEDDFFDPTDPARRFGPSSTCWPEWVFSRQGETASTYDAANIGNASDGPGLQGTLGAGTWVETRFSLERFRGRRARIRFLNTDVEVLEREDWTFFFAGSGWGSPYDDGIWIDDVRITNVLTAPVSVINDDKPNEALPGCGSTCNTVLASLNSDAPGGLPAPGQVVELSALDSVADRCIDGGLLYRFSIDGDGDGQGGGSGDTLLRNWTDDPVLVDAPRATTGYAVDVRCSSDSACTDSAELTVEVRCPSSGRLGGFPTVMARDRDTLVWETSLVYEFCAGWLAGLAEYETAAEAHDQGPAFSRSVAEDSPGPGTGLWYLLRRPGEVGGATDYCNDLGITWGNPSRDAVMP